MYVVVSAEKTELPEGSVLRMLGTWEEYCQLCSQRGDGSIPRIKFHGGEILLMSPLPRHGREANILADVVKILLDSENCNYEAFTPITMQIPQIRGIEPDYCFYIDHWQDVADKDRIDWEVEPPPDLVIEIDVSTYTRAEDYAPFGVPEVWLWKKTGLEIYALQDKNYLRQAHSRYFPQIDLNRLITQVLENSANQGSGAALRLLRQELG